MRTRALAALLVCALILALAPAHGNVIITVPPVPCLGTTHAPNSQPATGTPNESVVDRRGLRVFAMQYMQDVRNFTTYYDFAHKIDCMVQRYVLPYQRTDVPNLVVFNEDIGLATLAIGSRGTPVRAYEASPAGKGIGDTGPGPIGAAGAIALVNASYAKQIAYYQSKFPGIDPRKQMLLAATDTFARAFSQTFSDIARRYGLYVVASNNQGLFTESTDPLDVAALADPDLEGVESVYVATGPEVWNQVMLWGPDDVNTSAPLPERNLMFRNKKVPLTEIEKTFLALDEGPASGQPAADNIGPAHIPGTDIYLGFATSLPAFRYGTPFGQALEPGIDPCDDVHKYYMLCMDKIRTTDGKRINVVVQAEANPGRWASTPGFWQPLEWMESTWRAVADPTVGFRYNVTPHMVGNLLDLAFDGQSAITSRDGGNPPGHYVGNADWSASEDPVAYQVYAGDKPEFLALAPWVINSDNRDDLRKVGARLAPGSGDTLENYYVETAVWADLLP